MRNSFLLGAVLCSGLLATAPASAATKPAAAATAKPLTCSLAFNLKGWSLVYKHSSGTGTVTCSDGKTLAVRIVANGAGATAGKYKIEDGVGTFTGVTDIYQILGSYTAVSATAAAGKAATGQAMSNGKVKLSLSGQGKGWDLGVALSAFEIKAV